MAELKTASFGNQYSGESADIEAKKRLAEALLAQSQQPVDQPGLNGGMFVPRVSPLSGLGKVAQAIGGAYQQDQAKQEEKALANKYQTDLMGALTQAQTAAGPHPEAVNTAQEGTGSFDMSGSAGPAQQTVPGNRQAVINALMSHPGTQPLAMQQMTADLGQQQLMQTLASAGYGPGAQGQPPQGAPAPGGTGAPPPPGAAPAGAPARPGGIPAGVDPLAWALMVQKGDTAGLAKLVQEAANEQAKPVINRGYGVGRMVNGQYVPDQASIDQALAMERGKQGIQGPQEAPITLETSNGQKVQLSRPEWAAFQANGGQLPARLGGPATPGGAVQRTTAPTEAAALEQFRQGGGAPRTVSVEPGKPAPGMGTVGVSQPQEDVIRQQRETAAGKAVDEQFAKDYVSFTTGGAQDAQKQIAQLGDVQRALQGANPKLTGPLMGKLPDAVLGLKESGRNAIAMRERVEEVVQRSLRTILGAQFTEKEGERLIARAYNPSLSEPENAIRVGRLLTQLQQAYQNKQDAAQFFEKNNTLQGWKGKLPSMSDFDPDSQTSKGQIGAPTISPATQQLLDKYAPQQ